MTSAPVDGDSPAPALCRYHRSTSGVHQLARRHGGCIDSSGQGYAVPVVGRDDTPEAAITRDEAQAWFTRFLLRRVDRDEFPSTTQLDLIEKSIPRQLLDEYLGYQAAALKLRERYVGKFSKVLPGAKLARFFQIENKLDALTDLTIASNIPLTK